LLAQREAHSRYSVGQRVAGRLHGDAIDAGQGVLGVLHARRALVERERIQPYLIGSGAAVLVVLI